MHLQSQPHHYHIVSMLSTSSVAEESVSLGVAEGRSGIHPPGTFQLNIQCFIFSTTTCKQVFCLSCPDSLLLRPTRVSNATALVDVHTIKPHQHVVVEKCNTSC